MKGLFLAMLCTLGACGSVQHALHPEVAAPHSIAVLPFAGTAELGARDSARLLVHSRLRERGLLPVETAWTDRVLSERGWLTDPATFDPAGLPLAEVQAALGVDAVVFGQGFAESRWNLLLVRRHAFGGSLSIQRADGGVWWSAEHGASNLGGLLLASGQLLTELQAQTNHGTPMATLALLDEFVEDVVATVPLQATKAPHGAAPQLRDARWERPTAANGGRLLVEVRADAGSMVRFEVPSLTGSPMAPVPGQPDLFRGARDLPPDTPFAAVTIVARDAFGRETRTEVKP